MKTQSCKAKGRRLQKEIVAYILREFPHLTPADVTSRSMGASGEDILLSEAAFDAFPFAVEAKNVEKLNIWKAIEQAETSKRRGTSLVIFKRNKSKTYACIELDVLMPLLVVLYQAKQSLKGF